MPSPSSLPALISPLRAASPENLPMHSVRNESESSRLIDWKRRSASPWRECGEVLGVIAIITLLGWLTHLSYHALGHVYLLGVIVLSLRVGRWPVLLAAILSGVMWNYGFIPPRHSLAVFDLDDAILLGIYFVVALIAGQITAFLRAQERSEHARERRATALFHLTRALAGARTLDVAVDAALRQAEELFGAETTLLVVEGNGSMVAHAAGSLRLDIREQSIAEWARQNGREAGRFTDKLPSAEGLHLPMLRAGAVLGVLVLRLPPEVGRISPQHHELMDAFAAQIALLIEREQLRAASEREKLFAESDRLHRTLLDSVSHELKTPLAVLRSAGEKLETGNAAKQASLVSEVRTATRRLDHLVANLLNQTRLESGGLKPRMDWCDAHDLVALARRGIGDALAGRAIEIEIPTDMPLFMADAILMEQVVANLLLNAALHTPAGTPVWITAGLERQRGSIFLEISDRGPGLPPELQDNLFQKFKRGNSARAGGLGLGLSIVRGFMLAQGGEIEARNNPEGGACFTVRLPFSIHGHVPGDEN